LSVVVKTHEKPRTTATGSRPLVGSFVELFLGGDWQGRQINLLPAPGSFQSVDQAKNIARAQRHAYIQPTQHKRTPGQARAVGTPSRRWRGTRHTPARQLKSC